MAATLLGDWEDERAAMEASLLDELEEAIEASLLEKKNAIGASFLEEAIEASLLEDTNTQIENENAGRLVVDYALASTSAAAKVEQTSEASSTSGASANSAKGKAKAPK